MKRDNNNLIAYIIAIFFMNLLIIIFSTTIFTWSFFGSLRLQPIAIMVVSAGFYLPFFSAIIVSIFLGYLTDLISGGPGGIQLVTFILVLYVCILAERKLEIKSWPLQMLTVGVISILSQVIVISGISLINSHSLNISYLLLILLFQMIISAIIAPIFFIFLKKIVFLIDYLLAISRRVKK